MYKEGGGQLYTWAQRAQPQAGHTGLKATDRGGNQSITAKLAATKKAWHALWQGGHPWMPSHKYALAPVTGQPGREVLRKLKGAKAKGADVWAPHALAALPDMWADQLATFYDESEATGHWP